MTNIAEPRKPPAQQTGKRCANRNVTDTMLINCAAYRDGRKLADIDIDAISDYVSKPECFVWVALKDPTPEELDLMGENSGCTNWRSRMPPRASAAESRAAIRCSRCCIR